MSTRWTMHPPGSDENRKAAAAGFGVGAVIGAVVFYLARIFLARERIEARPPARVDEVTAGRPRRLPTKGGAEEGE